MKTFVAAQIKFNANSLLMDGTKVSDLITVYGDAHHIFPKAYLKENGVESRVQYNQVANYTYLDPAVNKAIGKKAPREYIGIVMNQCSSGVPELGNIVDSERLKSNLEENAIPAGIANMEVGDYESFLAERRKLMAGIMKKYYFSL